MSTTTEIISDVNNFDLSQLIYSKPREVPNVPGSFRINMSVNAPEGVSPVILQTDTVFSFGVEEATSMQDKEKVTGYTMSLCLWNSEGPTKEQEAFIDCFNSIVENAKQHVLLQSTRKTIKKIDLVESDLRKFNPIYRRRDEDGNIVPDKSPMLYPKLITSRDLKIFTNFADPNGYNIEPFTLLGVKNKVKAVIKFDSIFVGSKISLQIKVLEVEVQPTLGRRRLLLKPQPAGPPPPALTQAPEEADEEETDYEEESPIQTPVPTPTPIRSPVKEVPPPVVKERASRKKLTPL